MTSALATYDSARRALGEAVRVDQVQSVLDEAEQLRLYARQASDRGLMADAMEIQLRAERRLGELLVAAKAAGQFGRGGAFHAGRREGGIAVSLEEAGVSRKLSSKAQQLAAFPEAAFRAVIAQAREKIEAGGAIVVNPLRDLTTHDKQVKRQIREMQLAARQRALPEKRYGVIYADPEWPYETWSEAGKGRSAENHYPTSLLPVIAARPVEKIAADDCALFLWVTRPMLPAGLMVLEAWGFAYVTCFGWGKVEAGTGYWARDDLELLLLGRRGDIPAPAMGTQYPALMTERKTEHSRKPDWAYAMIEAYFPTLPKIELNARARRAGWDAWGFEAPADAEAAGGAGAMLIHAGTARSVREMHARKLVRYQLRRADGAWLHMTGDAFVTDPRHAWIGFARERDALLRQVPEFAALEQVEVPPVEAPKPAFDRKRELWT